MPLPAQQHFLRCSPSCPRQSLLPMKHSADSRGVNDHNVPIGRNRSSSVLVFRLLAEHSGLTSSLGRRAFLENQFGMRKWRNLEEEVDEAVGQDFFFFFAWFVWDSGDRWGIKRFSCWVHFDLLFHAESFTGTTFQMRRPVFFQPYAWWLLRLSNNGFIVVAYVSHVLQYETDKKMKVIFSICT